MNKLAAFTLQTPSRMMFGQSAGIDLRKAMQQKKILLVSLRQGLIGSENASLIGSVLLSGWWHAVLSRTAISPEKRRPYWLYLDEAHTVVRLPMVDVADMLGMARGLSIGVVGATQYMSQLPPSVRDAVLSTVRSQVLFQLDSSKEAKLFADQLAPYVSANDLRHLGKYEVVMRLNQGGNTGRPTTGVTRGLPERIVDPDTVTELARLRHGTPRHEVEAALLSRTATEKAKATNGFGVRKLSDNDDGVTS